MRRLLREKIDHYDGMVFWAKDSFDRIPHGPYVQHRFNQLFNNYQDRVQDLEDTIDDQIRTGLSVDSYFRTIVPVVNAIVVMAPII